MPSPGFKFLDVADAAQLLGLTRLRLLELVDAGRIHPFTGKGQQSVFRRADVERLAAELETGASTQPDGAPAPAPSPGHTPTAAPLLATQPAPQESPAAPRAVPSTARPKRRDAIKLIGTRLSMDSRWAEISDEDIATWLDAIEPVQFDRIRKVAALTIERLNHILASIDADPRVDHET